VFGDDVASATGPGDHRGRAGGGAGSAQLASHAGQMCKGSARGSAAAVGDDDARPAAALPDEQHSGRWAFEPKLDGWLN